MNGVLIDVGDGQHTCCVTRHDEGVRVIVGRVIGPAFVALAEYILRGEGVKRAHSPAGWNIGALAQLLAEVLAQHQGARARSALLAYMRDQAVIDLKQALAASPRSWTRILRILHTMHILGVRLEVERVGDVRCWPRSARDAVRGLAA